MLNNLLLYFHGYLLWEMLLSSGCKLLLLNCGVKKTHAHTHFVDSNQTRIEIQFNFYKNVNKSMVMFSLSRWSARRSLSF